MLMEWTVTTRLTLHTPDDPIPKKRLIIRSYPAGDTSGLSCWAWYSWVRQLSSSFPLLPPSPSGFLSFLSIQLLPLLPRLFLTPPPPPLPGSSPIICLMSPKGIVLSPHPMPSCRLRHQGYNAFVLEYGRHTLDDFYPVSVLRFNAAEINTDPAATNLVALLLNATHVTVRLQVNPRPSALMKGSISRLLPCCTESP